jgi:hypothetical protein
MTVGTPIGTAGFVKPVLKTYQDTYPHLKRIERPDFRGQEPSTQLSPSEEHASMRAGAMPKGSNERPVISPLEAIEQARQARTAGAAQAVAVPDVAEIHSMLAALQADLNALRAEFQSLRDAQGSFQEDGT